MKALIIYFSGTGNTQMITDEIVSWLRQQGWDAEAISVEKLNDKSRDFNFNLRTMDLLGFGFPVYKFSYPEIMNKIFPFLSNLKPSRKPFFVFSTFCRFASTALHRMAKAIERTETAEIDKSHALIAMRAFKCPSNGISSLKPADSEAYQEVMYFEPDISNSLEKFVMEILNGTEEFISSGIVISHSGSRIDRFREKMVEKIERARYPLLEVDPEKCIGCGLCAKRCPEDNLFMQNKIAVPRDTTGCLHCLRCLHVCPKNAITFGPLVEGPLRYRPAIRKRLYKEAAALSAGAAERGTPRVNRRWASGNIVYFIRKSISRK